MNHVMINNQSKPSDSMLELFFSTIIDFNQSGEFYGPKTLQLGEF